MEDWQLLRDYCERGSEAAFRELMGRHLDLVYSTALRRLGDAQAAEDVAQGAFCLLARKAPRLNPRVSLVGWLYQTAFFMASRHQESEHRRRCRELEAAQMGLHPEAENARWEQIAPVLDEAMNRLSDPERTLLLLRFFKRTPLHEVGKILGVSEDAARMRVNRSLDKLRDLLHQRGIASTAAALATILTQQTVTAASVRTSQAIQTAVIQSLARAGGPTLLTAIRTAMKPANLKTALLAGSALIVALIATLHVYNRLQTHLNIGDAVPMPPVLSPANRGASAGVPFAHVALARPAAARVSAPTAPEQPAQVNVEAKFIELSESAARSIPLFLSDSSYHVSVLSDEQFRDLVNQLEQTSGVDIMSAPNVTTLSGRQAQISVTVNRTVLLAQAHTKTVTHPFGSPMVSETTYLPTGESPEVITNQIQTGPSLDIIPYVQDNGTIQLTFVPAILDFLGYQEPAATSYGPTTNGPGISTREPLPLSPLLDPDYMKRANEAISKGEALPLPRLQPRLRSMLSTNNVTVGSGQSVLCGPFYHESVERVIESKDAAEFDPGDASPTNAATEQSFRAGPILREVKIKKATYVIVTAQIVDPAGNPVGGMGSAAGSGDVRGSKND